MSVIEALADKNIWFEFYEYKKAGGHLPEEELQDLMSFILLEEYLPVVKKMKVPEEFPYPKMTILNKKNTNKKRTVFTYDREENYVLKCIAYLLLAYDSFFSSNTYAFRKKEGVKKAIGALISYENIGQMYSYKVDIHDYFNSVDVEILLPMLERILENDIQLYTFMKVVLKNPYVEKDGEIIEQKKGIMAGIPVSSFLANLYLHEMDAYFEKENILYARYSDDVIVFARTEAKLQEYVKIIDTFLQKYCLSVNPEKVKITKPGEKWEFLGFSYQDGVIDLADVALQKMKGKLKRKARAIYRWKRVNGKKDEYAIRAYIKYLNKKFFNNPVQNEITWCRWYFPIINTEESLRVLDHYTQDCIRYLVTGRYSKANYNLRYETMKELGYRSLVNEYYKKCKDRNDND